MVSTLSGDGLIMRRNRLFVTCAAVLFALAGVIDLARAQTMLVPTDIAPGDRFGSTVALSGPYMLVNAAGVHDGAGVVYAFRRTTDGWTQEARLVSPNAQTSQNFGQHLALDRNTAAIGEPTHSRPFLDVGTVYIFERDDTGTWHQIKKLSPPAPRIATNFGQVALKGDTLLVGAVGANGTVERQGLTYVYARHHGGANTWGFVTILAAPDGSFGDWFGSSPSLEGSLAGIGALGHDTHTPDAGAVYLFRRNTDSPARWTFKTKLVAVDGARGNAFGTKLVMHRSLILVGAPRADGRSPAAGAAYLYARSQKQPDTWHQIAKFTASDGARHDRFGASLAMNEDWIVIGAPDHDGLGEDTGILYAFARQPEDSTLWQQIVKLTAPASKGRNAFAHTLALRGDLLVVGAPGSVANTGAVYTYDLSKLPSSSWLTFELLALPEEPVLPPVEAIVQDRSGFLWFATHDGLHRYDGYTLTPYRHDPNDATTLTPGIVLSLLEDQQGHLWVGTEDGLSRFDHPQNHFVRYALPADSTYPRQSIRTLFEDRDGTVWIGTNGRIYRYDTAHDRFNEYEPFTGPPEGLDERYISGIQQDRAGHLWVLSKNLWENRASLYRIDLKTEAVTRYPIPTAWGQLGPFLIDSQDDFWIKAPEPLTFSQDGKSVLPPAETPVGASHWTFHEDQSGVVWIGTLEGLYHKTPTTPAAVRHELGSVLAPNLAVLSVYESRSGRLLLGTRRGILQATASGARVSDSPPVVLTSVQISNRDGGTSVPTYGMEQLNLSYRDYSVAFEYAALTFAPPEQNRYHYRLAGYDQDWIDAGTRRFATYSNLPPGRYTFEVALMQEDGSAEAAHLALPLVVKPALWQTGWFRGLTVLLVAGLLAAAYRYRVKKLLEMERMRLRIASDLHDDVSSNLSGIALMSEIVRQQPDLPPVYRHQLARIAGTAQQTVEDLRNIVWLVDPGHDRLNDLLLKMKDTAATLLNGTAYTFHTTNEADPGPLDMEFRRQVFLIYKEILHNIARHAQATSVEVEIGQHQSTFVLSVRDDGIGFDPSATHSGHGLRNLHRRSETVGGRLNIDSQPGTGTQITLTVKMA